MAHRIIRSASADCMSSLLRNKPARPGLQLRIRRYHLTLNIPSELWGATNLIGQLCRQQQTSSITKAASSFVVTDPPTDVTPDYPKTIKEALDYQPPPLTLREDLVCFIIAVIICSIIYQATAPTTVSLFYAAGMMVACATSFGLLRAWLLERGYRAVQRAEHQLATPSSRFHTLDGAALHYSKSTPTVTTNTDGTPDHAPIALHCLHGFGASSYSWSFVVEELANRLKALVTAHDMPGFGLSHRSSKRQHYTLAFNGKAARSIMDAELDTHTSLDNPLKEVIGTNTTFIQEESLVKQHDKQQAKRVLVGHSMGGAAAAEAVIQHPEGIAALILVAPAIVAFWTGPPDAAAGDPVATVEALVEEFAGAQDPPGVIEEPSSAATSINVDDVERQKQKHQQGNSVVRQFIRMFRIMAAVLHAIITQCVRLILLLLTPALVILLRKLVRSKRFWERGLASAWLDKSRITSEYVDNYRLPQLVRGWELGILRFMAARFSERSGFLSAIKHATTGDGHLSQAERLAAACAKHGIKVLIVHGTGDALVPLANSRRLAKVLPECELVECTAGHMPQEECPELFVQKVTEFVSKL